MSWLTTIWTVIASACLTLAAIHVHVWMWQRQAVGNAAFALLAASVAGMAYAEVHLLHADTTSEFGRMLWWYQITIWTGLIAPVAFVLFPFHPGRVRMAVAG